MSRTRVALAPALSRESMTPGREAGHHGCVGADGKPSVAVFTE